MDFSGERVCQNFDEKTLIKYNITDWISLLYDLFNFCQITLSSCIWPKTIKQVLNQSKYILKGAHGKRAYLRGQNAPSRNVFTII